MASSGNKSGIERLDTTVPRTSHGDVTAAPASATGSTHSASSSPSSTSSSPVSERRFTVHDQPSASSRSTGTASAPGTWSRRQIGPGLSQISSTASNKSPLISQLPGSGPVTPNMSDPRRSPPVSVSAGFHAPSGGSPSSITSSAGSGTTASRKRRPSTNHQSSTTSSALTATSASGATGSANLGAGSAAGASSTTGGSSSHRRSRSLGGVFLGTDTLSSPIGGPDGVDPNLVAAISASGQDIPGAQLLKGAEHRVHPPFAMAIPAHAHGHGHGHGHHHYDAGAGLSSSPGTMSSPAPAAVSSSTATVGSHPGSAAGSASSGAVSPIGTANTTAASNASAMSTNIPAGAASQRKLNRKPSDLLNVMPDTRALANTYPSMAMPNPRSGSNSASSPADSIASASASHADGAIQIPSSAASMHRASMAGPIHQSAQPTPVLGGPASYSRARVRSQTMAPRLTGAMMHEGGPGVSADASAPSSLSASVGTGLSGMRPPQFPLADAIRLQRVPTAVRLAGDLCVPSSPVASRKAGGPFAAGLDTPASGITSHTGGSMAPPPLSASTHGPLSSHGLGIGLSGERVSASLANLNRGLATDGNGLPIPQTPSTTRSPSPAYPASENPYSASQSSASGRTSPVHSIRTRDRMSGSFVVPKGFQLGGGALTESGGYDITASAAAGPSGHRSHATSPSRAGSTSASRRVSGIMTGAPPSPTSSRRFDSGSVRNSIQAGGATGGGATTSAFSPLLSLSTSQIGGSGPFGGSGTGSGAGPAPSPVLGPTKGTFENRRDMASGAGNIKSLSRSSTLSRSTRAESDAESMPPPPLPASSTHAQTALDSAAHRSGPAPWIASSREVPAKVTRSPPSSSRPSSSHGADVSFGASGGILFNRAGGTSTASNAGSASSGGGGGGGSIFGSSLTAGPASGAAGRLAAQLGEPPQTPVMRSAQGSTTADALSVRSAGNASSRPRSSAGGPGGSASQSLAGTDEYSRIIVQSRNAKVQRWKSSMQARQTQAQSFFRGPMGSPAMAGERTPMQRMDSADAPTQVLLPPPTPNVAAGLNAPVHSNSPGASAGLGMGIAPAHTGSLGPGALKAHGLERRGTIIGLVARENDTSMPLSDSMDSMPGGSAGREGDNDTTSYSYYYNSAGGNGGMSSLDDESGAGAREIEWVDWLDEYRKMKEAKLRSEQAESEAEQEAESEYGHGPGSTTETETESVSHPRRSSRTGADLAMSTLSSEGSRMAEGAPSTLSALSVSALTAKDVTEELSEMDDAEAEADHTGAPSTSMASRSQSEGQLASQQRVEFLPGGYRRPAGKSTRDASEQRRVVSAGVGTESSRYGALANTSPITRLNPLPHDSKPRMVSLSPIPTRVASSSASAGGSSAGSAPTGVSSSSARRRRNLLGTKIENWWNAVKTGFAPPSQADTPSSSTPAGPSRSRAGFGIAHRLTPADEIRATPGSQPHQHSFFSPSSGAGQVRTSENESQRQDVSSSTTSAVGELRKQASSQHIETASSAASSASLAKKKSTASTAEALPSETLDITDAEPQPSPTSIGPSGTSIEPASSQASSRCSEETTGRDHGRKRHPYLSLDLDKNISSFSASAFESLESSATNASQPDSSSSVFPPNSPRVPSPLAALPSASSNPSPKHAHDVGRSRLTETTGRAASTPSPKSLSRPTTAEQQQQQQEQQQQAAAKGAGGGVSASAAAAVAASAGSSAPARPKTASGSGSASADRTKEDEAPTPPKASSKEITINSIRQHIRHRLAVSKESCDKELCKVIAAVSQYVEDQVAIAAHAGTESVVDDSDVVEEVFGGDETDTESAAGTAHTLDHPGSERRLGSLRGQSMSSATGSGVGGIESVFGDMDDLVDPDETPQPIESVLEAPTPRRGADMAGTVMQAQEGRSYPSSPLRGSISRSSKAGISSGMPLARHKSLRQYNRSASTSRSTSRSHSPMPAGFSQASAPSESPRLSPVRRFRPLPAEDLPMEPYIPALQDLVTVAMEVLDTPIQTLTSRPGACSDIISHIQTIGKTWDNNPDWPGRGWYVQLLLAVAGLSRVVEWWEAEKGFWNFDDENDQADAEPLNFIMSGHTTEAVEMQDTRSSQSAGIASAISSPARNVSVSGPRRPGGSSSPTPDMRDRRTVSESDSSRILAAHQADADVSSQALEPVEETPGSPGKEAPNVLMELSLDGRFVYLSPAWTVVVGTDPAELYDQPVSDWLAPGDSEIFAEATRQLQLDEAHTVEVTFRLRIDPSCASSLREDKDADATYFQEMEGKGMLMHDRETRQPTHVMWVFKASAQPELEGDLQGDGAVKGPKQLDDTAAARVASAAIISLEPVLCRICEREIPAWFFESHSEICNEIHRLEMEIAEVNESLAELRRTIRAISAALVEEAQSGGAPPQFRGIPLSTPPPSSQPPSALEGLHKSVAPKQVNHMAIRKAHLRAIDGMLQMLQTAKDISTPAIKEESAAEPIERQRLLTPTSESRMVQVHQWRPTRVDDPAIDSMLAEVESAVRAKLSGVNRMRNTIVYVERVRQEWIERVDNALSVAQQDESDSGESAITLSEDEEVLADVEEEPALEENENRSNEESKADSSPGDSFASRNREKDNAQDENDPFKGSARAPSSAGHRSRTSSPLIPPANISPSHLPSPLPSAALPPPATVSEASFSSRSRRASHLPGHSGDTPPFSPHHGPADGQSSSAARRLSMSHRSPLVSAMPLSPRIPPSAPSSRPTASSIKDFEVIKPISKGAFGSVYLAKKKTTGDYFAIKVLKKSDMIAKNQITNVKAERMILMGQTSSPFVVKLFFTFQSRDYLFLVMEYLPGGDCASLCKNIGPLAEHWARQYIAEVVNGLEQLHEKGVVHRDMKPDNLLIDQKGHLKLTDFGLSKIGLLGRQTRNVGSAMMGHSKSDSASSSNPPSNRSDMGPPSAPLAKINRNTGGDGSSDFGTSPLSVTPGSAGIYRAQSFFAPAQRGRIVSSSTDVSDSSGSEGPSSLLRPVPAANLMESPGNVFGSQALPSESISVPNLQGTRKFVGTPDYLAPESILGIGMDDMAVDWWALGVILYEFLYGIPPFHAETPDRVFDNILSRRIDWDEDIEVSDAARDLMERLMCTDPQQRLGAKGAAEVKAHPFFEGVDWSNVAAGEGPFVPNVPDPESTDYFDLRGAAFQEFNDEEMRLSSTREFANALQRNSRLIEPSRPPSRMRSRIEKAPVDQSVDEFGSFSFKNLPVLKQANDEMVRKMRGDQLPPMAQALETTLVHARHRSLSGKAGKQRANMHPHPPSAAASASALSGHGPPSPSTSVSSQSSAPSRSTAPTSPSTAGPYLQQAGAAPHKRRPSEYTMGVSASTSSLVGVSTAIMDRKRSLLAEGESEGQGRKSSRMRTSSLGASSDRAPVTVAQSWQEPTSMVGPGGFPMESSFSGGSTGGNVATFERGPASDGTRPSVSAVSDSTSTSATAVTSSEHTGACLIAEDNPIALRMLETIISKLGLRTTSVRNGAEATALAMGEVRYSAIFLDLTLPIVSGQDTAKMIKSTRNPNSATPIIALASFDRDEPIDVSHSVFDAVIAKPVNKHDVLVSLQKVGFAASVGISMSKDRRGTFMFPAPPASIAHASNAGTGSTYAPSESAASAGLAGLTQDSKRASTSDTDPLSAGSEWGGNSSRRESHMSSGYPPRTPLEKPTF